MKKLIFIAFFLSICLALSAKQIDENTAKLAGKNFLISQSGKSSSTIRLTLVYKSIQPSSLVKNNSTAKNYFYIFNCSDSSGFVIVSADDIIVPILGYSIKNSFETTKMPSNLAWWLQDYCDQMQCAIENNLLASKITKTAWKDLVKGKSKKKNINTSVSPLLHTEWDQSPYYNDLCPYDNTYNELTVTGCAATAMAQIMKYWNYPSTGIGSHSYVHPTYGTLSANFGTTSYNWNNMPNDVTTTNNDVATLMYDCGVSVEMNYGVGSTGGSGAWVLSNDHAGYHPYAAEHAYPTYFGYNSTTIQGKRRSNYPNDADWIALLKIELDNNRPIQYAGWNSNSTAAHTWVCDGYDQNNYFHMNWGWSGSHDDYYTINLISISGSTIFPYTYLQQALIGIAPPSGQCNYSLSQNSYNYSSIGGVGDFDLYTSSNCSWNVTSNNPSWIHITSGTSGTGNSTISYTVDPNTSTSTLSGSMTVVGTGSNVTYYITETGLNCSYILTPNSSIPFSSIGGSGSFSLNTNSSCQWSAFSNDPSWLHITSASTGTGPNSVYYIVDPNLTTSSLSGTISVADQIFTVTEDGSSVNCIVTIIPNTSMNIGFYQGNYSFVYNLNSACSYSILSSSPDWLIVNNVSNNVIYFSASANSSYFPRTGYIYINGVYKKITQEGNTSVGIDESSQSNTFIIYPNPVSNNLTIEAPQKSIIQILNIQDQLIKTLVASNAKTNIDVSDFPSGVYVVEVKTEKGLGVKKFIKE